MIKQYLNQPYLRIRNKWKLIIIISLFIALFMLLFQPFGLSAYKSNYKALVLLGYAGITFGILVINQFVVTHIFRRWFSNWTVGKQIIWLWWIIFSIGTGNYLYSAVIFPMFSGWKDFLLFQILTLLIGVFPVVAVTLISYNIKLKQNLKTAAQVNDLLIDKPNKPQVKELVVLVADNGKDKLEVELSDLIYIESVGNYIQVSYYKEKKSTKMLLRGTIKRIEEETQQHPLLVKCHRAFIVNIDHVESVMGNSQELRLVLKNVDEEIPVSRNNAQKIKNSLS